MKTILIFFFLVTAAMAGDYCCFDGEGTITEKYRSVDGADLDVRSDCIKITRDTLDSITKYHKVDTGVVVEMSQAEKDAVDAAEAQAENDTGVTNVNNMNVSVKDAFAAWLTLYNSKVPAQYEVTPAELKQQVKDDLGLTE